MELDSKRFQILILTLLPREQLVVIGSRPHIGLKNLNRRLFLMYGEDSVLHIEAFLKYALLYLLKYHYKFFLQI